MADYRRVYDSRHMQADCQEPRSAPEPYARQSSMGYAYLYLYPHSLRSSVYATVEGPSVCLSVPSFDSRCWAPRGQDVSIDSAGVQQQRRRSTALSSKLRRSWQSSWLKDLWVTQLNEQSEQTERQRYCLVDTVSQKKQDTKLFHITSPNVNPFLKFFHYQTQW